MNASYATAKSTSTVTSLQQDAWAWCNASYHTSFGNAYRDVGTTLYQQDISQRIQALFARSDEQNKLLDTELSSPGTSED